MRTETVDCEQTTADFTVLFPRVLFRLGWNPAFFQLCRRCFSKDRLCGTLRVRSLCLPEASWCRLRQSCPCQAKRAGYAGRPQPVPRKGRRRRRANCAMPDCTDCTQLFAPNPVGLPSLGLRPASEKKQSGPQMTGVTGNRKSSPQTNISTLSQKGKPPQIWMAESMQNGHWGCHQPSR